jgi:hypothetical protein
MSPNYNDKSQRQIGAEWHSVKAAMDESVVCFFSRGSNLESIDCAGFVKIARNDPEVVKVSKTHCESA